MESLNRLSINRAGLSSHRLDGRVDLAHSTEEHRDLFERASVQKVAPGARADAPQTEIKQNPWVALWERCAQALNRWANKIFG